MRKPRSISIIGRRWFQRSAGNTYHSAQVVVNGEQVHDTGIHYGYGDQYLQTAAAWLVENDYLPENARPLSLYCRENGIAFTGFVSDVAREKDL